MGQGIGIVSVRSEIRGTISAGLYFLGLYCHLALSAWAPVRGRISFETETDDHHCQTLKGPLSVSFRDLVGANVTIVDRQTCHGMAGRMSITTRSPIVNDTQFEICGHSPKKGFYLRIVGPYIDDFETNAKVTPILEPTIRRYVIE